jgi:hypothetical protein
MQLLLRESVSFWLFSCYRAVAAQGKCFFLIVFLLSCSCCTSKFKESVSFWRTWKPIWHTTLTGNIPSATLNYVKLSGCKYKARMCVAASDSWLWISSNCSMHLSFLFNVFLQSSFHTSSFFATQSSPSQRSKSSSLIRIVSGSGAWHLSATHIVSSPSKSISKQYYYPRP